MTKHTMRDVARLAGVSVATVSAVINGTATVSEGRSKRVRNAMEALD
jgi:LacI family transcriptional regulator